MLAATLPSWAARAAGPAIAPKVPLAIEGAQGAPSRRWAGSGFLGFFTAGSASRSAALPLRTLLSRRSAPSPIRFRRLPMRSALS
jgi:hypothetical protein